MKIINIVFRERPAYRDMQLRPFGADATDDLISKLCFDTNQGTDLTPAALSGTAGRIIRPVAESRGKAIIANGWDEKRYMFIMTVEVRRSQTIFTTLEISGYTDTAEVHNGLRGIKFPPEMALYFNSITEVEQMYDSTAVRGRGGWKTRVCSSNHVIIPQTMPDFSRERASPGTVTMRPNDIFRSSGSSIIQRSFDRKATKENFIDGRYGFADRQLRMSTRWNDSSTRYLNRSINALSTASNGEQFGDNFNSSIDIDTTKVITDARRQVPEKNLVSWRPMADLSRETNILEQGFITYGELANMNPDFAWDDVKVYFLDLAAQRDLRSTTSWGGRDNSTVAANILARGLPSYMAFHQIGRIEFEANNTGFNGTPVIMVSNVMPLLGNVVDERALASLEQRLQTELFVEMLPWDDCRYDIRVSADLGVDVHIDMHLDDEDPADFVFPVFCDSLVSPVIANHNDDVTAMGETIAKIVDSFGSATNEYSDSIIETFNNPNTGYNF
ncbi:hypothetical protein D9M68_19910 [compost metagenome]